MKFLSKCYIGLIFFLLYIPIVVLIIFSFNESGSLAEFSGFSLTWYKQLFRDRAMGEALINTLVLGFLSSAAAGIIGTLGAVGIIIAERGRFIRGKKNFFSRPWEG